MANLDGCLKGKHSFGSWYYAKAGQPQVDEFFRFRCHTCGAWMWRSELSSYDVEHLRKAKRRVKWEVSVEQDKAARLALTARKFELQGGSVGVHSTGSSGVDSPRSPGVDSVGSRRRRKAVGRG